MNLAATLTVLVAALAVSNVEGYTNPVTIKGYRMFDAKTGDPVAIKGIDYYPRPNAGTLNDNNIDFFTDDQEDVWGPDIEYLAATGANAVRLYAVDPSKSHDAFMCALRAKGMYALIDLAASCQNCAITKDAYPACYSAGLKSRGEQIILAFAQYDNVLGFSAGNEVNNEVGADASVNAPCQKKFIRDMRTFIASCKSIRQIPVGVVLADPALTNNNREVNAKYYNCRTDATDVHENAEWYGLNAYQYCDNTAKTITDAGAAGFKQLQTDFLSYNMTIPVMLTEYGCLNANFPKVGDYEAQRTWLQTGWLYSSDFRKVFSGGFAFEYSTELQNSAFSTPASVYPFTSYGPQNYGLGYFSPADCDHTSVACVYNPMPNYDNLTAQYNATDISSESSMAAFTSDRVTIPTAGLYMLRSKVEWYLGKRLGIGYS
ncbi:putative glycoside hydrolase [Phytophthora cinnamomi]|uniref:putative glycoside hydrolase n=1 Tax=Phytophthora cinnamomi TaxID=4785 RepID=UPI0035594632|nr:putative glycoside hydrolase [Phytophthora cinnamomi]